MEQAEVAKQSERPVRGEERAERIDRAGLERLDRDSLIAKAELAGVGRARILTRPELVDELVQRDARLHGRGLESTQRARGFFGKARDLLARVVERGLNLPDAAERIRAAGTPPPPARTMASALPTVTLAELYATQGHTSRAVETLRRVLDQEPEHSTARALLAQLEDTTYKSPDPVLPPEPEVDPSFLQPLEQDEVSATLSPTESEAPAADTTETEAVQTKADAEVVATKAATLLEAKPEPFGMLDDAPLPLHYDADECIALPVDPTTLFVYWEVRDRTRDHLASQRGQGGVALRVLVIIPSWEGPRTETLDYPVGATHGDWFVRDLPAGCVVRAAIGWKEHDVFMPIAHSPALETPPGEPSPVMADTLVRWTPEGIFKVTKDELGSAASAISHAVDAFLDRVAEANDRADDDGGASFAHVDAGQGPIAAPWNPTFDGDPRATPLGSSERMATSPFAAAAGAAAGTNRRPRANVSSVAISGRSLGSSDRIMGSSERMLGSSRSS